MTTKTIQRRRLAARPLLWRIALAGLTGLAACATGPRAEPTAVVRRDPVEQFEALRRVTTQVERQTRDIPDARYANVTRGRMLTAIREAGFSEHDAAEVMLRVDESRADRARVARLMRGGDSHPVGDTALRGGRAR